MKENLFSLFVLFFATLSGVAFFSQTALARPVFDVGGGGGTIQEFRNFIREVVTPALQQAFTLSQSSQLSSELSSPQPQITCPTPGFTRCSSTQIQTCIQGVSGLDWSLPRDCGPAGSSCQNTPSGAQCITPPGTSVGPTLTNTNGCFKLTVGYGSGAAGNPFNISVGEGTPFYLHWDTRDWNSDICGGTSAISQFILACHGEGTFWQGNILNKIAGDSSPFSFSGLAPSTYNGGLHNFQVACDFQLPQGVTTLRSNLAFVQYIYNPPVPTCTTGNECSPNQCWNLFQARPCTLDQATGCYKWAPASTIQNCIGGRCDKGVCIGGGGGPTPQPGQSGAQPSTSGGGGTPPPSPPPTCRPGFDPECTPPSGGTGATPPSIVPSPTCTLGVNCPSGCTPGVDCPSGVTPPGGGGGGAGGGAGAVGGGPVFGATQCSDGVDNDKDGKIDYNGGYLLVDGRKVQVPPDPSCKDSSGQFDWRINSEGFHFREIIPDFFNLNWFKLNFVNFFKAEALAK